VSEDWWIGVNDTYKSREKDGDLVYYKPGRSVFVSLFGVPEDADFDALLKDWLTERGDEHAKRLFMETEDPFRFAFKMQETLEDHTHRYAVNSLTVSNGQMVDLAIIVDLKEHLEWAENLARHVAFGGPDAGYEDLDKSGPGGLTAVSTLRVCSGDLTFPIRVAHREEPEDADDSGWRFLHGSEDDVYVSDYHNFRRQSLTECFKLDNGLRRIISNPIGSRWEREDVNASWHIVKPE
jgi:hypothetical protein